jgi:hypothetical protein
VKEMKKRKVMAMLAEFSEEERKEMLGGINTMQ